MKSTLSTTKEETTMFGFRLTIGLLCMCVLGFAAIGCSDRGPVDSIENSVQETPDFIKMPKRMDQSLSKIVSTTAFITRASGGVISLRDTFYAAPDNRRVTLNISLDFEPLAMPYDAWLTLTVDDELFLSTISMTYGPHGIVFDKPARLRVEATGLDLGTTTQVLKLFYINSSTGLWEQMPASNAVYVVGALNGHGKLPHFSQYAFGRNQ